MFRIHGNCSKVLFSLIFSMMNFATSLCKRLNLRELVSDIPVYSSGSGMLFIFCYFFFGHFFIVQ